MVVVLKEEQRRTPLVTARLRRVCVAFAWRGVWCVCIHLVDLEARGGGGRHEAAHQVLGLLADALPLLPLEGVLGRADLLEERRVVEGRRAAQHDVEDDACRGGGGHTREG